MVVINITMNYGFNTVQEKVPGDIGNESVHSSLYFKQLPLCVAAAIHPNWHPDPFQQ